MFFRIAAVTVALALHASAAALEADKVVQIDLGQDPCVTDANCTGSSICVDVSPTWSQCVDCSNFENSCPYWDAALLAAASEACQENCPTVRCDNKTAPCYGDDVCVEQTDDAWSQCVDCSQPDWQNDCVHWATTLRAAAVHVCGENCLNCRCTVDDIGMECVDGFTCVVQDDGGWSQCVDCGDEKQFQTDCQYSWTDEFTVAAEAACDLTCNN